MKKIFLSGLLFLAMLATANTAFADFNFLLEVTGVTIDGDWD